MASQVASDESVSRASVLLFCLRAQEVLESIRDAEELASAPVAAAYAALDRARMLATNSDGAKVDEDTPLDGARARAAVAAARDAVAECGLADALREKIARAAAPGKERAWERALASRVTPGVFVGGWTALRDDCAALRARGVSAILSIGNFTARRFPPCVEASLLVEVDDTEHADLGAHFPAIVRFVARALARPGGACFIHCGAGISRAPSAACAYLMWRWPRLSAAEAIKLVRGARPCARPNAGFRQQLKAWERARFDTAGAHETPDRDANLPPAVPAAVLAAVDAHAEPSAGDNEPD